jgi:hypothetical protein
MKPNCFTGLLLYAAIITACNGKPEKTVQHTPVPESGSQPQQTAAAAPASDTIFLSQITPFTANETNTVFTAPGGWEVTDFETGSRMTVHINGQPAGSIDFSKRPYDGPGFAVYHYAAPEGSRSILLVEAQADPGTAWYCAALLENNQIVKQWFIDEPRCNTESHALQNFMSIFETGGKLIFRFNKQLVAAYSGIPAGMRQNAQYAYRDF